LGLFAPLALLALPLLGIVLALYLLRLRRPQAPVGSLHLWSSLIRDREANTLWQRLRVSLLLLLQVVALLVMILALARPWVTSEEPIGQNVVLVVDISASMGARDTDSGPTRLQQAQEKARDIIDKLPQGASAMLIASDNKADVVVPSTDDRARLRGAVDALVVRPTSTDMLDALKLASAVAARQANSAIWVFSDGAFPRVTELLDPVKGALTFVPVGVAHGNQGVTALQLSKKGGSLSLFVQISNSEEVSITRRLDLIADDAPWSARNVSIGPLGTQELVIDDVPLSTRVLQAQLAGTDALQMDDKAWVVNRASVPANILLVSKENKFLELALSLLPTVTLYKVAPEEYSPTAGIADRPFDLTVFDASVPVTALQSLPPGAIMMFAPAGNNPLVEVTGVLTAPVAAPLGSIDPGSGLGSESKRDPLLKFVDLSGLHVARAQRFAVPAWAHTVLEGDSGPLILAGTESNRNIVLFAFDLRDSDLPLQTAYPLLMRNLVTYLLPPPAGGMPASIAPGEPVAIDRADATVDSALVEDPQAREARFPMNADQTRVAFGDTGQVGVYYVTQYAGPDIVAQEAFAVNLFSRDESLMPPNRTPGIPAGQTVANTPVDGATQSSVFRREMWPVFAVVGIVVLLLEWLYAQRIVIRRAITEMRNRRALRDLEERT
jgi:Ca-activated chloride channel homolog